MTSLAIVPMQGSVLDSDQAARAFQSIRRASTAARRDIAFATVFTRTPASLRIRSRVAQQIAEGVEGAGIATLPTTIAERTVYRSLFAQGGTLRTLQGAPAASIESARVNAAAFARDVLAVLSGTRAAA